MVAASCANVVRPTWLPWLGGAALGGLLGAATMALVDPVAGRRRRAALGRSGRRVCFFFFVPPAAQVEDAHDVAPGAYRACAASGPVGPAARAREEARLLARVRRRLGQLCADDHAIEVRLEAGVLELHGEVRRLEQRRVVQGVRRVYGVDEVRNFLRAYDRHARADDGRVVH